LIMPERTVGGSFLVTIPGVSRLSLNPSATIESGFAGTNIATEKDEPPAQRPNVVVCHFSLRSPEVAVITQAVRAIRGPSCISQLGDDFAGLLSQNFRSQL
jgi:hypothetical protein